MPAIILPAPWCIPPVERPRADRPALRRWLCNGKFGSVKPHLTSPSPVGAFTAGPTPLWLLEQLVTQANGLSVWSFQPFREHLM